jgi:hypothetical protein
MSNRLPQAQLLAQLDAARRRVDRATELLERSLDLRERLQWGLDLDDMVEEVRVFKRDCRVFARRTT